MLIELSSLYRKKNVYVGCYWNCYVYVGCYRDAVFCVYSLEVTMVAPHVGVKGTCLHNSAASNSINSGCCWNALEEDAMIVCVYSIYMGCY